MRIIKSGDSLAGGGGVTNALKSIRGVDVKWVLNHDPIAIRTNMFNNKGITHYLADFYKQDEHEMEKVDFFWISVECFVGDTLILTKKGPLPIKDVAIGDYVLTHKNRWRKVVSTMFQKSKTVKIKGQGLIETETTKNHPFYCLNPLKKWNNARRQYDTIYGNPEWTEISKTSVLNTHILSPTLLSSPTVFEELEIPPVGGRGFEFTEDFWWMVGRWLGDGCISKRGDLNYISICSGDHEADFLEKKLSVFMPQGARSKNGEIVFYKRKIRTAHLFTGNHNGLSDWLLSNFGKYSYDKTIPGWALGMKKEWRKALLDGYVSADGHLDKRNAIQCTTVSHKLHLGIKLLSQSLGNVVNSYKNKARNNPIEGRVVKCRDQYASHWYLTPKRISPIMMHGFQWSRLVEYNETNEIKEVYNIQVEEDESYVANGIVVHNCTQHSQAKGGKEKNIGSYMLPNELIRYIIYQDPFVIGIENVPEFKKWGPLRAKEDKKNSTETYCALEVDKKGDVKYVPIKERQGEYFKNWKKAIQDLGYEYHENIRNAADDGMPTRRVRYFAFFTKSFLKMKVFWPAYTHHKTGANGLKKWVPCRDYINLSNEGESIFGRQFNPNIKKHKRNPLVPNTLKRIAGGIKKEAPEFAFIMHYYGNGTQSQTIDKPLHTITTKERQCLITLEKKQFIQDYCWADIYNSIDEPTSPQLTWESKHLVTVEPKSIKSNFMVQHYSGDHSSKLDEPMPTITTIDHNTVITAKAQFISKQYNSNGKPEANNQSLNSPMSTLTTEEKIQFITAYFSSGGSPESQNQSLDKPLGAILTETNKKALITALRTGDFDFDIKMRFLDPEEMSRISTFPERYFTDPRLKLSRKQQTKLIGNAVPPKWAKKIIEPVIEELRWKLTELGI